MLVDSRSIGLFDQYMGMTCRLRCSWISLVLIYLIFMGVKHVPNFRH